MSGFLGPWFCSLFFNTSSTCKKQTHVEAHTYPHFVVDALNKTIQRDQKTDCWVIMLKVGPFDEWSVAEGFRDLWVAHTRGKQCRLERGVLLYHTYCLQYSLRLWVQSTARESMIELFFTERPESNLSNLLLEHALAVSQEDKRRVETISFADIFKNNGTTTLGCVEDAFSEKARKRQKIKAK
jgi:hypothetical protein